MSSAQLIPINSLAELRRRSAAWDDLWWRSGVCAPTARAELVAQWLEHFAPQAALHILAVEQDGQLVAALPLCEQPGGRLISTAILPTNDWSGGGDLLLDPLSDLVEVTDTLVAGLKQLPVAALCFEQFAYRVPHWQALIDALERAKFFLDVQPQYLISEAKIGNDWQAYLETRSGGQMKTRLRHARKMEREGGTELRVHTEFSPGEVEQWMRLGFEIEAASWKGTAGTAVVQQPGMAEFYIRNACQLAEWGQLAIFFLEFAGQPIAFDYAWHAKGCHFCVKIGYDDAYRKYGPGQQMYLQILERLHEDPEFDRVDFWGQKMPWNEAWATGFYPVGRLVAAPRRSASGYGYVAGYKYLRPLLHRLRGREKIVVPEEATGSESTCEDELSSPHATSV